MVVIGTYKTGNDKDGKACFFYNTIFLSHTNHSINFLDYSGLYEKFSQIILSGNQDEVNNGYAYTLEDVAEEIISSNPDNTYEIYLAPEDRKMNLIAINVKDEGQYSIHRIPPHIDKDYIPRGIWANVEFSRNFMKFYNYIETNYNDFYALHAIQRSKDNGIVRTRMLRTWAFSSKIHMLESMDEIVDFCTTNRARLMVSLNPRSIIKTAIVMQRTLADIIDAYVSGNKEMCTINKLTNLFMSSSQMYTSRSMGLAKKLHMIDIDVKDPNLVSIVDNLLEECGIKVELKMETVNGYHYAICMGKGSKELYGGIQRLEWAEIKKDPIIFLGKFEPCK